MWRLVIRSLPAPTPDITLIWLTPVLGLSLSACSGPLSTLDPAGPSAQSASYLTWGMLIYFTSVMVAVIALWLYAMVRKPTSQTRDDANDNKLNGRQKAWIIGGGVILPSASMLILWMFSIPIGNLMSALPTEDDAALQVRVTAHQWWWQIDYPSGEAHEIAVSIQNELHIPAGAPVHLYLTSADVIHSFWVPRLAGKLDMIPGRTNELRIQADEPGVYHGLCAEFCGLAHASMQFEVHVLSRDDFDQWFDAARQQQAQSEVSGDE